MVFKSQESSYLKEYISRVRSCEQKEFTVSTEDETQTIKGYAITLEETIFFPEGGGQPCDQGFLNNEFVYQVVRNVDQALHMVTKPFEIGEELKQVIDWERRFDHMQQHTGQHLLSAIIDKKYKYETVSWYLGKDVSHVELDCTSLLASDINNIESTCNHIIREGRPVTVQIYDTNTPEKELDKMRSVKGLPADHKGDIRVITISDIDSNMCCGTHVANLSELQAIKLLKTEKSKRKGKLLLYFQVGGRILRHYSKCLQREEKLTSILKTNPNQHFEFVTKLMQTVKIQNKQIQGALKEIMLYEIDHINKNGITQKYYTLHRSEAEPDFMNAFIKQFNRTDVLLFLSVGDEKGAGSIVIYGEEHHVKELGPPICDLLCGKGVLHKNKYQAKVTNLSNKDKAVQLMKDYFS